MHEILGILGLKYKCIPVNIYTNHILHTHKDTPDQNNEPENRI